MYRFEGLDIEVTGGDSLVFAVRFDGRAVPVGSTAVFTVKKRYGAGSGNLLVGHAGAIGKRHGGAHAHGLRGV